MLGDFPAHVQIEVRRILNAEARRLLEAQQREEADNAKCDDPATDERAVRRMSV